MRPLETILYTGWWVRKFFNYNSFTNPLLFSLLVFYDQLRCNQVTIVEGCKFRWDVCISGPHNLRKMGRYSSASMGAHKSGERAGRHFLREVPEDTCVVWRKGIWEVTSLLILQLPKQGKWRWRWWSLLLENQRQNMWECFKDAAGEGWTLGSILPLRDWSNPGTVFLAR